MGKFSAPGVSTCNALKSSLAEAIGINTSGVDPVALSVAREFAFSSDTSGEFAYWYLVNQMFSKFNPGDASSAQLRRDAAFSSFKTSEETCALSNTRLVDVWSRPHLDEKVWLRARRLTSVILGRFSWESFPRACGFGPGASSGLRRKDSCQQNKWVRSAHITAEAIPYYHAFRTWAGIASLPSQLTVVEGNKVTTVPKSFKTDRCIAIEPDWNMFLQKGVGKLIRRRLQRFGILLPTAQDYHKQLARLGSWTGHLATLDMSAASDSISLALCEALLPPDWFKVINDLRSPVGRIGDEAFLYEKVSSMGNGYTFELETLLFYVLTLACCRKEVHGNVSCYGDDVICPTEHAPAVVNALNEAGFTTNSDKSFIEGPFRESCGGHYWRGVDVSPFYVRATPKSIGDLIVLGNHMQHWNSRFPSSGINWKRPFGLVRKHVPKALRGPWGVDGCLWSNWDESQPRWHTGYQCYQQLVIQREHRYADLSDKEGAFLHKLWTEDDELEASVLAKAKSSEKVVRVSLDREQWVMLPARIA